MLRRLPREWKSFLRDNAYVGAATGLSQVSSLLFSAVFARRSAEGYGDFQYFLATIGLLTIFSIPGLKQSLQIEIAKGDYPVTQFVKTKLRYSVLTALAAFIGSGLMVLSGQSDAALIILLSAPLLPLYYALPLSGAALETDLRFDVLSRIRVVKSVTISVILAGLVLLNGATMTISLTYLVMNIAGDSMLFWYTKRRRPNTNLPPDRLADALGYARSLTMINAVGALRQHMDRFVIGSFLSSTTLSVYAIAAGIPQRFRLISRMTSQTIFPRLASLSDGRAWLSVRRQFPRWAALTAALCIFSALIARPFILLVYGQNYTRSIDITYILIAITGLGMLSMPLATLFESKGRASEQYRTVAVSSIIEIGLLLATVPTLKLVGVLWARGVSRTYLFAALSYLFWRYGRSLSGSKEK